MGSMTSDAPAPSIAQLRILAVDDHDINRELLKSGLAHLVHSLELASSGPEAIQLCQQKHFDLILMDLHMPDMDGLETMRRIRHLGGPSAEVCMVVLTADTRPEEQRRLLDAGFQAYLSKPISIRQLAVEIDQLVQASSCRWAVGEPTPVPVQLINLEQARLIVNGDEGLVLRMQGMLANDLQQQLPEIDQHLSQANYEAAAAIVHQWAGAANYAGAEQLAQACHKLHPRLLSDNPGEGLGGEYVHFLRIAHSTHLALEARLIANRRS